MARVGFKKTYAAGTFNPAAVSSLFENIRTTLVDAGFNVLLNTSDAIDVIRLGSPAGTADDDVPHWAFTRVQTTPELTEITAKAVHGPDYLNAASHVYSSGILSNTHFGNPSLEVTFWFAADGQAGWWWLVGANPDATTPSGFDINLASAGVTCRRYPSDHHQGLCARYGLWDGWGSWFPAYVRAKDGTIPPSAGWLGTWSPFGMSWDNNGQRHPGSPLPRMAVPQFPALSGNVTACVLGEFNEVLALTDGYLVEEAVLPGWIAFSGNVPDQPFALPAPASFTVL